MWYGVCGIGIWHGYMEWVGVLSPRYSECKRLNPITLFKGDGHRARLLLPSAVFEIEFFPVHTGVGQFLAGTNVIMHGLGIDAHVFVVEIEKHPSAGLCKNLQSVKDSHSLGELVEREK